MVRGKGSCGGKRKFDGSGKGVGKRDSGKGVSKR